MGLKARLRSRPVPGRCLALARSWGPWISEGRFSAIFWLAAVVLAGIAGFGASLL